MALISLVIAALLSALSFWLGMQIPPRGEAVHSADELGQLCTAFETMRQTLMKNNQELRRQAEERKRLNTAFSHDLRNPVTVLKGSIEMASKCAVMGTEKTELLLENLTRIKTYTGRTERYVETMSNAGRLEQIQIERISADSEVLAYESENSMRFVAEDSGKQLKFSSTGITGKIYVDGNILFQITENLISKAQKVTAFLILIAVIMSAIMTTVIGQSIGTLQTMRIEQAEGLNGNRYATFHQLTEEQVKKLHEDNRLYDACDILNVGDTPLGNSSLTLYLREYHDDTNSWFSQIGIIHKGHLPEKENEIALSKDMLNYPGLNVSIGDTISLDLTARIIDGSIPSYGYSADFILTLF